MHRPELLFDGKGINGPDEYRTRIATFTSADAAEKYGPLFEAAPELLEACELLLNVLAECEPVVLGESYSAHAHRVARAHAREAIAKARGRQ